MGRSEELKGNPSPLQTDRPWQTDKVFPRILLLSFVYNICCNFVFFRRGDQKDKKKKNKGNFEVLMLFPSNLSVQCTVGNFQLVMRKKINPNILIKHMFDILILIVCLCILFIDCDVTMLMWCVASLLHSVQCTVYSVHSTQYTTEARTSVLSEGKNPKQKCLKFCNFFS